MPNFAHFLDLSIDAMDVSGEHHLDVLHSVYKTRLAEDGKPIAEEAEQYELGASNDEEPENRGEGGPGGGGLDEEGREGKQGEEQPIAKDVVGKSEGKCGRYVRVCCVCQQMLPVFL